MIMLFFFFENKDIKLKDYTKECGRLKDYLDFLYLNLVRNEKRKPKGVGQLLKNVQRIRTGEFQRRWDPACPKDAIVYPILVGRKMANTEVKKQKSANMDIIHSA